MWPRLSLFREVRQCFLRSFNAAVPFAARLADLGFRQTGPARDCIVGADELSFECRLLFLIEILDQLYRIAHPGLHSCAHLGERRRSIVNRDRLEFLPCAVDQSSGSPHMTSSCRPRHSTRQV